MTTSVRLERRQIALGPHRGPWPLEFLILDSDGDELRAAYYRLRHPGEHPGGPGTPDEETWRGLIEAEYVAEKSKREAWVRRAGRRRSLDGLMADVLIESRQDPATVAAYIRATPWGERL